jgi:hypothetical protein
MRQRLEPKIGILPPAQREIWPQLAPAPAELLVLYGGTAVALHLGHRQSVDFDFFSDAPLNKRRLQASFAFMSNARIIQDDPQTLVISANAASGAIRISFFGELNLGHVNPPLQTSDGVLLIASLEDLMATKLKAILDRAEAKDYRDIAAMLGAGVSLERGLAAFAAMFARDPALPLRALGYFKDGDLSSLSKSDQDVLRAARNRVVEVPQLPLMPGLLS